ncbi:General amino-acid permease GAP2 [Colletotrichum gloeosporioides]|uniref:General amino-acid permease GAP2 n=1 Tax=Colletotrichum gloeosporioides TaxID=474922 RepID=A0A8H4CP92_COLGL|nr:General amino-acid permease GAP2 [Colletotrichum gloeosporioides]KAF3807549.1 General amino-acid permease GAP2 [Colletotrichum gloeosporioides]
MSLNDPVSPLKKTASNLDNVTHATRTPSGDATNAPITAEGEKLERNITIRQMVFIALGGSIGAGLFVGSGGALSSGGPLNLVLNFALVGLGVGCTMGCLGELAASYPVAGAFYDYSRRMISEPWGFAMGWNFVFNWLIVFPFELTTIAAQIKYWVPDLQPAYVITPILFALTGSSFLGSRWFGELEHAFGIGKALAIAVFIFAAIFIIAGAVPTDPRHGTGAEYWVNPGAVKNGVAGFFLVFRTAGMSYGGTELLGLTAAECKNPQKALPLATKIVFARIFFFYIVALLLLGFVVPSNDPNLASTGHGAKYSPFTLAAQLANIKHLPDFFNVLIVVALISMANASIFAASRAFQALCEKGMGPKWGAKVKWGVPVYAFLVTFLVGLLAFVNLAEGGEAIFDWLLSLSGASNYYTWASICFSHIRFRRAWAAQGHDKATLLWRTPFGTWGAWVGLLVCILGLLANIITAAMPVGGKYSAQAIVRDNIGTVIPPFLYFGYRFYQRFIQKAKKPLLIPLEEVDLRYGLRLTADSSGADLEQPTRVQVVEK